MLAYALLRGFALGLAAALKSGYRFGAIFGFLSALGLILVYFLGFAPSREYRVGTRPSLSRRRFIASCARGAAIGLAGILAGALAHEAGGPAFGLEIGLVVGIVGTVVGTFNPLVEWWADNLPERRLGLFGALLVMLGFAFQSLQYWLVLLGVSVP